MFKSFIQKRLESYVQRYFKKHPEVKLVVVTGSVGKTSTKEMIATILSQSLRVRMEDGNHNTHLSAPVSMLGIEYPSSVHNVLAWLRVFAAAEKRIRSNTDVDVIVQELGTDRIGEIDHFGSYLKPTIAVVSAVTPEHMEFFGSIEAVAKEELAIANHAELALINRDDIEGRFAAFITNPSLSTYGSTSAAEYHFDVEDVHVESGFMGNLVAPELPSPLAVRANLVGEHSLRPLMGAVAVAIRLGLTPELIKKGVEAIRPVPGRMNPLPGVNGATIIDDTYNSSPAAAAAALQTLYRSVAPQRIAVLGSMNELGDHSVREHELLGDMCDPTLLAWVVTVGEEANQHLAPHAKAKGCQVKECKNALEAGAFAHKVMEEDAVVLFKGSQGGIYLEEAVKIVLHSTADEQYLVRQSASWLKTKQAFFEAS